MMRFKIPFDLPASKRRVHYAEFNNSHHFNVIKYMSTDDDSIIETMFDEIIHDLTGEDATKMFAVDKFCLLLDVRSVALGDKIEFKTTTQVKAAFNLSSILNNIRRVIEPAMLHHEIRVGDVVLTTSVPRRMQTSNVDDLVHNSIYTIQDQNDVYYFDDMSSVEQQTLLASLPADVLNNVIECINKNQNIMRDTYIIKENTDIGISALPLGLYDNSLFSFLKSIYSEDLMGFYELQYSLITKLHISHDHFMQMTPNECRVFINIHNKEMKKQEDAQKSNDPKSRFPAA
jgi:hypothetical protein